METSYKFRLYPTKEQSVLIEKTFGCCRFVYNHYLYERKNQFQETGKTFTRFQEDKDLKNLKSIHPWLSEVDSHALQCELKNLDESYKSFFRRVKCGIKPVGYPKFKKKHESIQSYKTNQNIYVNDKYVKIPKVGLIKAKISKKLSGRILNATISRRPSGKYFVSIVCTDADIKPLPLTGAICGVDLGIKALATTSDGIEYPNRKFIKRFDTKLRRESRRLSRKQEGSKRREKQRIRKAKLEEHIANQRRDYLQKTTTELIRNYDVVCIENLKTKGMMQNHKLARAVSDVSFSEFRREIEYKAKWYGKTVRVVDTFFPSSQLCHFCGFRNPETKNLSVREWICPECGKHHDRDFNAAINILHEGLHYLT